CSLSLVRTGTVHRDGNHHPAATSVHPGPRDRSRSTCSEVPDLTHPISPPENSRIDDGCDWFESSFLRSLRRRSSRPFPVIEVEILGNIQFTRETLPNFRQKV
ncbi:unnamed protein product, partial [Prunus brigantina]